MCICGEVQSEHVDGGRGCPAFDDVQQFVTGVFEPLTEEQLNSGLTA